MTRSADSKTPIAAVLPLILLVESLFGTVDAVSKTPASGARGPFETITVTVQVVESAALGSFAERWDPSVGPRVDLSTPVYGGIAQAGVHVLDHGAVRSGLPEFRASCAWLGWAYRWELPRRLSCAAGVEMGVSYMRFDDETAPRARTEETELGFGATSLAAYALSRRWSVVVTVDYRKVLTRRPIEYVLVGAGLGRTFTTPGWLREFLD